MTQVNSINDDVPYANVIDSASIRQQVDMNW